MREEYCYVIRYRHYVIEEDGDDNLYHQYLDTCNELFFDETKFNERITELSNMFYADDKFVHCDGVDITDLFRCDMHRVVGRI